MLLRSKVNEFFRLISFIFRAVGTVEQRVLLFGAKDEIKKVRETRNNQLKQKNKVLDATKMNLERLTEKHENMEITYRNKI